MEWTNIFTAYIYFSIQSYRFDMNSGMLFSDKQFTAITYRIKKLIFRHGSIASHFSDTDSRNKLQKHEHAWMLDKKIFVFILSNKQRRGLKDLQMLPTSFFAHENRLLALKTALHNVLLLV